VRPGGSRGFCSRQKINQIGQQVRARVQKLSHCGLGNTAISWYLCETAPSVIGSNGHLVGAQQHNSILQHHPLNAHEFEQSLENSEGQGSLACCSPCGHKESDTTQQLNDNSILHCI